MRQVATKTVLHLPSLMDGMLQYPLIDIVRSHKHNKLINLTANRARAKKNVQLKAKRIIKTYLAMFRYKLSSLITEKVLNNI